MNNKEQHIETLEHVIRSLADVWPADRENVAVAGAKFEEFTHSVESNFSQLQKLIDLSWNGIKHLYEKDEYFITVKTATMQAVNTIREYIIEDGNIKVEDFEKAYDELDRSMSGGGESADTIIELNEDKAGHDEQADQAESFTLNDLAAFLISVDEETVTPNDLRKLDTIVSYILKNEDDAISKPIRSAMAEVEANNGAKGWLKTLSDKTEEAIQFECEKEWNRSETEISRTEHTPKPENPDIEEPVRSAEVFIIPHDIEVSLVGEFITECSELIEMAESALLELESNPDDEELINTVFRAFHTIKGTSAFMGLDPISGFTHFVETVLSMVRDGELPFDRACADINLESIDILNEMLDSVENAQSGDELHTPEEFDSMIALLHSIAENGAKPADALEKKRSEAAKRTDNYVAETDAAGQENWPNQGSSAEQGGSKPESESSVRVSVDRLDRLIDMVGELVIAHSVVAQDQAIEKDSELQKKVNHTTKILRELQDTSLTLRMVPLKATFHKMNRLVRDLSRKAGKQVKFSTFGEDTEIDRNMVDVINEPLIHMLRNSLDHGVEEPEERVKKGKSATANISISAAQEGGKVVIEIKDDGRGIDTKKMLRKAVEKGLVEADKKLTDKEIYNLIFLPGFSSADKVTDLSGRGVGMDVVRRSIEQLQGKVEVSSEFGKGTTITIELPFTLAITDGMLVQVGGQRFIVPTISIDMTFRAQDKDLFTMMGHSEQVNFRGYSVPVIRLHNLFEIDGACENLLEGTLLIIKSNNRRYALLVDKVVGQQQLVGKSIHMLTKMSHISGGAILGDGRVGLILDTAALIESAA